MRIFCLVLYEIDNCQPQQIILIDYPGFNLHLAKKINSLIKNKNRYHQIKVKQKKSFNNHLNFDYQFKKSYKIVLK